jgi:hypothetical protein
MRKIIALAIISLTFVFGNAQAEDATPGGIAQVFGCTLQEGKSSDNIWSLMDSLARPGENDASTDPAFGIFFWAPYRSATPYDFVFGVLNSDLVAMAEGSVAYAASAKGQADGMQFENTVSDCDSVIVSVEELKEATIGMTADRTIDAVVETFSCSINEGSDMDDVHGSLDYWKAQLPKIDSAALDKYGALLWTPLRGGTGSDFIFVGNSPDLKTWAEGTMAYDASSAGQAADKRFFQHSTCTSAMWNGYWIVAPEQF